MRLACVACCVLVVGCGGADQRTEQARFAEALADELRNVFDDKPIGHNQRTYHVTGVAGVDPKKEPRTYLIRIDFARAGHDDHSYQWRILARQGDQWRLEDISVETHNHKSGDTRIAAVTGTARNAEMARRVQDAFNQAREKRTF